VKDWNVDVTKPGRLVGDSCRACGGARGEVGDKGSRKEGRYRRETSWVLVMQRNSIILRSGMPHVPF